MPTHDRCTLNIDTPRMKRTQRELPHGPRVWAGDALMCVCRAVDGRHRSDPADPLVNGGPDCRRFGVCHASMVPRMRAQCKRSPRMCGKVSHMADTIPVVDLSNLTFRIDRDMRTKIERIAEQEQRSVASLIRVLLTEALKAREGK